MKSQIVRNCWAAIVLQLCALGQWSVCGAEEVPDFNRDIRPILSNACFHCHGPDEANRGADLRLDDEETAKEYAIVPGDLEASEVIRRITSDDPDERMPPPDSKRSLTAEQVDTIKRWVAGGAPWAKHWSFVPPQREAFPRVEKKDWPQQGIDYFTQARLEKEGLAPSPRASRETLIRRATLDLIGLPPTLEEVDAFLADESPDAFEKVVDRLLASPHYGEHMALPWLAAARYADTNGYQQDKTRTMWPWRDWVVRAMNDNMPFDEFTVNQLAGDLLKNPTRDQLIATGFHRNHALNGEGGRNPEESRVEYVIDRAETTGTVWMGLTVGCARCHDHKYDLVSQKEFYQLYAYFNTIDEKGNVDAGGNAKPVMALPTEEQLAKMDELRTEIVQIEDEIAEMQEASEQQQQAWIAETKQWLKLDQQEKLWTPFKDLKLECEHGVAWNQLDDGSVLVTEKKQMSDAYVVSVTLPKGDYRGLRFEALRHESFTKGLFSKGVKGAFSITDLEAELEGKAIKLVQPQANYAGEKAAKNLLDNNRFSEWFVSRPEQAPQVPTWLARFESPVRVEEEAKLVVRLKHESRTGQSSAGRFRLSVTEYPSPTIKENLGYSEELVEALQKSTGQRDSSDNMTIKKEVQQFHEQPRRKQIEQLSSEIKRVEDSQLYTMVMRERKQPRDTFRLVRGLWNNPDKSEKLHPGVLACLPSLPEGAPKSRLSLAEWLVRPDHPLTSRVTVNRYWQHFFGTGIVKTSEDFGVQGDQPSHPQLLDWLATEFIESGWDVKHIHKLIVMSATYQQASRATPELIEKDPANRLFTRGPRFRLSAQSLRDQALAVSGLLVQKLGGPGVMPYQPLGVWSDFSLGQIKYKQGHGEDLYRRSLYIFWRRSVGPTVLFDNPARQACTVRPSLTNTPLHALTTLNDVTFVEAARVFAQRVMNEAKSSDERIQLAFRLATARRASDEELEKLNAALEEFRREFQDDPEAAALLLSAGESPRDEKLDVREHAAYTCLMNAILNLDEVLTKG